MSSKKKSKSVQRRSRPETKKASRTNRTFITQRTSGILVTSYPGYFRLLDLASKRKLIWLRWQLFASGVAQTIVTSEGQLRRLLPHVLSNATARGSLEGSESLLLSCLQAAQLRGNRSLVSTTLETLRTVPAKRYEAGSPPIAFFDKRTSQLILMNSQLWPNLVKALLGHSFLPRGARIAQIIRAEVATSSAVSGIKPQTGVWSQLQGIDKILIALGAASDCLFPGGVVSDPYGTSRNDPSLPPGTTVQGPHVVPGNNNDPTFRYICWVGGGKLIGDTSQEDPEPEPPEDDGRTLDEVLGEPDPPLTQDEIDDMTAPTPPPDDGQTLDEVLGEPDPPLTPEEIDDMTSTTPNPNDDGTAGPTRGPIGPAATPVPDDLGGESGGGRGPINPALTPRPEDGGTEVVGGPIGPAFLKASYSGQRFFPRAGAYFLPATGYSLQSGVSFHAEFLGSNVGTPVQTTFLLLAKGPGLNAD